MTAPTPFIKRVLDMTSEERSRAEWRAIGRTLARYAAVLLARFAAGTLRDPSVDHAVANLLFAMMIRRLDAFDKHESKGVLRQIISAGFRIILVDILHNRKSRSKIRGLL